MSSENVDLGLAALGPVHLGAERRDLDAHAVLAAADGAEALALEPDRVGPRPHDALDDVGTGVGRDVDVGPVVAPYGRGTRRARCRRRGSTRGRRRRAGARAAAPATKRRAAGAGGAGNADIGPILARIGARTRTTSLSAPPSRSAIPRRRTLHYRRLVDGAPNCSRLGCDEPATTVFAFDARESLVWLDPLGPGGRGAGVLCGAHADRMSPPRGWNLLDRRGGRVATVDGHAPAPHRHRPPRRRARRERAPAHPTLRTRADRGCRSTRPFAAPGTADPPATRARELRTRQWSPHDRPGPEFEHVLDARTPLLARAFECAPGPSTTTRSSSARRGRRGDGLGRASALGRSGAGAARRPPARDRGRRGRARSASHPARSRARPRRCAPPGRCGRAARGSGRSVCMP